MNSAIITYRCNYCFDRGRYFFWSGGAGKSLEKTLYMDCPHCSGAQFNVRGLDPELKDALQWFRTSVPPKLPFRLSKWRTINDPEDLWSELRSEIAVDNIYRLELIREDLITLQGLFSGEEF